MDDKYFDDGRFATLTYWALGQMMKGAGYAAAFTIAIGVTLAVIWGVGQLLPEESKQAPSPYGALEQPLATTGNALA